MGQTYEQDGELVSWITPKTDWRNTDNINIEDYNRIIGNLEFIHAEMSKIGYRYNITPIGNVTHNREDVLFVLNGVENNTQTTADNTTVRPEYQGSIEQFGNKPFWDWHDLNRIEGNIFGFRRNLNAATEAQYMIPLYCGVGLMADKVVI
jgi:hypothetical protein